MTKGSKIIVSHLGDTITFSRCCRLIRQSKLHHFCPFLPFLLMAGIACPLFSPQLHTGGGGTYLLLKRHFQELREQPGRIDHTGLHQVRNGRSGHCNRNYRSSETFWATTPLLACVDDDLTQRSLYGATDNLNTGFHIGIFAFQLVNSAYGTDIGLHRRRQLCAPSMAARVAQRASSTRSFFSFISVSLGAPTLMTATPPDSLARRS